MTEYRFDLHNVEQTVGLRMGNGAICLSAGVTWTMLVWRRLLRIPISWAKRRSSLGLCLVTSLTATGVDPPISALNTYDGKPDQQGT